MADQGLTLDELRIRAEELAEMEAYSDTAHKPNWTDLINWAYREFVWFTEARRCSDTFPTVAQQAEYELSTPHWKLIEDVIYDSGSIDLVKTSEAEIRRSDPLWLTRVAGTPSVWCPVRPNVIRLHDKPDTSGKTVTLYGVRAPDLLVNDGDYPIIPPVYHEQLSERAYQKASKRWARGEAKQTLLESMAEYEKWLLKLRGEIGQAQIMHTQRRVPAPMADRVLI